MQKIALITVSLLANMLWIAGTQAANWSLSDYFTSDSHWNAQLEEDIEASKALCLATDQSCKQALIEISSSYHKLSNYQQLSQLESYSASHEASRLELLRNNITNKFGALNDADQQALRLLLAPKLYRIVSDTQISQSSPPAYRFYQSWLNADHHWPTLDGKALNPNAWKLTNLNTPSDHYVSYWTAWADYRELMKNFYLNSLATRSKSTVSACKDMRLYMKQNNQTLARYIQIRNRQTPEPELLIHQLSPIEPGTMAYTELESLSILRRINRQVMPEISELTDVAISRQAIKLDYANPERATVYRVDTHLSKIFLSVGMKGNLQSIQLLLSTWGTGVFSFPSLWSNTIDTGPQSKLASTGRHMMRLLLLENLLDTARNDQQRLELLTNITAHWLWNFYFALLLDEFDELNRLQFAKNPSITALQLSETAVNLMADYFGPELGKISINDAQSMFWASNPRLFDQADYCQEAHSMLIANRAVVQIRNGEKLDSKQFIQWHQHEIESLTAQSESNELSMDNSERYDAASSQLNTYMDQWQAIINTLAPH